MHEGPVGRHRCSGCDRGAVVSILAAHPLTPNIACAGLEPGLVCRTVDGGQSWAQVAYLGQGDWSFLAIDPHTPERLYASGWHTGSLLARSVDSGDTWQAMTLDPGSPSANDIEFHPTVSGTLYVIAPGLCRSTDAGATWEKLPLPDAEIEGWALLLDAQSGLQDYIAHNGRGVLSSGDGGESWAALTTTFPISPVTDIEFDPADSQTIYVSTGRRFLDSTDRGSGVLKTTDGGATWTSVNQGLDAASVSRLAVDPEDPAVVYAGGVIRPSRRRTASAVR